MSQICTCGMQMVNIWPHCKLEYLLGRLRNHIGVTACKRTLAPFKYLAKVLLTHLVCN